MDDVRPLPLEDDEELFSDFGTDDAYARDLRGANGGRLVINADDSYNSTQNQRINPFQSSELRIRSGSSNGSHDAHNNSVVQHVCSHNHSGDNHTVSPVTDSHCHVTHAHEPDNTVRNQLIAISAFTTLFMIGEGIGKGIRL